MKQISVQQITETVRRLCIESNVLLPDDVRRALDNAAKNEKSATARGVLADIIENYRRAEQLEMPICQDTGTACVFVELGQQVEIVGGLLSDAINQGVAQGYIDGYLRKSVVADPLDRVNTRDNTPAMITYDIVEDGVFKGGNISLGVAMRFRALNEFTASLPLCEATEPNNKFGQSTKEAIEQGVMQGILHEIEGYVERISAENNKKSIIFCGGDAESFVNRIKSAIFAPRKLMFTGLNRILEYNVSQNNI